MLLNCRLDFEKAQINAFRKYFPSEKTPEEEVFSILISVCTGTFKHKDRKSYMTKMKMLCALSYVPPNRKSYTSI